MAKKAKKREASRAKGAVLKPAKKNNRKKLSPTGAPGKTNEEPPAAAGETDIPTAGATRSTAEDQELHRSLFSLMVARSNKLNRPMVCYRVFHDGSAQVCRLMDDGGYGDCETYTHRPVPGPRCG
jgi:hypothetical protein